MLSFLTANRVAKNAPEKADIVAKRQILVGSVKRNHDCRIDPCSRRSNAAALNSATGGQRGIAVYRAEVAHQEF